MADISDDPPPSSSAVTSNSGHRTTVPGTKRLLLTISVLLSFLLALPFLLKSTDIYRSPLPFASISALASRLRSSPPSPPCRLHAVLLLPRPPSAPSIEAALKSRSGAEPLCGPCGVEPSVSVTIDSRSRWMGGVLGDRGVLSGANDEAVDRVLDLKLREGGEGLGGGRVYTVVVVEGEGEVEEVRAVVGKHRHGWIVGKNLERDAVASMVAELFVFFMNGGKGSGEAKGNRGDFVPVGADGNLVLSFSLLNADPSDWVYDWDFQNMEKIFSNSVVNALAPIANITIESQVLYHTPTSSNSYRDEKLSSYVFGTGDLPFFVNSNEWHLDTSVTAAGQSKVLQFVVYVPGATECPLLLQLPDGGISKTNGFISPMWGGVVVWNPPECSGNNRRTNPARSMIYPEELDKILQVFTAQLRMLFGLKSNYQDTIEIPVTKFLSSEKGFSEWELDALYREHACLNLLQCATTLESLSNLVQSLPRMIIMDEIGKEVKLSLEAASLAQANASLGSYDASAASSRQAKALAEDAFFHPSIMSISYSSMEHYFAIYMPFFAPVCLHVILSTVKELKRYKRERAKYIAYLAEQKQKKSD